MSFDIIAFYMFAALSVGSALCVITARNPVHSVLWLIAAFFATAGLFVLLGAEFIAMILAIVYVGAVAVLFLFVVMMLDVDFVALKKGANKYLSFGLFVGAVFLIELGVILTHWVFASEAQTLRTAVTPTDLHNTAALGQILYTDYVYPFQVSGLILLTAMIGAIVLTLRHRRDIKRQNITAQILRDPKTAIEMRDVDSGKGL